MSYDVVFLDSANIDIAKAYKYYGEIGENLIDKFEEDLNKSITEIKKNPKHYRKVKRETRQLLMTVFSYVVVYQVVGDKIVIARVFHTSRNPKSKYKKTK